MTDREIFPANAPNRSLTVSVAQRGSLVARGLAAIQNGTKLALTKDNGELYRQARDVYDLMTNNGVVTWVGECIQEQWIPISALTEAFIVFQRLAAEGFGKAYYPLSTLYSGKQSAKGNEGLAENFARLAFDWCLANSFRNDPEIWNDLGQLYRHRNYELAVHWCHRAAMKNHPWGLFNMWSLGRSPNGLDEAEEGDLYWLIKAAEQGNLRAIIHMIHVHEGDTDDHEPNDEPALYWYRKAAEQGYPWTEADFGAERFFYLGMHFRYGDDADNDKAEEYFLAASKLGDPEAQYQLAELLDERGDESDSEHWLKSSADLGYGPALLAYAKFVPENEAEALIDSALDWYKAQAESGDEASQFEYATMLLRPTGNWRSNPEEGMHWLKASAEQDYSPACRRLGDEYLRGALSDQATRQGIYWLSRAAELNDSVACESLGDLYLLGHSQGMYAPKMGKAPIQRIEPNQKMAVTWYERGIAGTPFGNRPIAFKLGQLYLTGEHLQQDLQLAEKWLLHSAEHGYGFAQKLLGDEYLSGNRLHKDVDAAIHWLELACESSVATRLKLAGIYLDGKVVPQSLSEAIYWLTRDPDGTGHMSRQMKLVAEKCFDGGFGKDEEVIAQKWLEQTASRELEKASIAEICEEWNCFLYYDVGEIYEFGLGVDRDMEKAIYWYKQAAGQGHHTAKIRLQKLGIDWKIS